MTRLDFSWKLQFPFSFCLVCTAPRSSFNNRPVRTFGVPIFGKEQIYIFNYLVIWKMLTALKVIDRNRKLSSSLRLWFSKELSLYSRQLYSLHISSQLGYMDTFREKRYFSRPSVTFSFNFLIVYHCSTSNLFLVCYVPYHALCLNRLRCDLNNGVGSFGWIVSHITSVSQG